MAARTSQKPSRPEPLKRAAVVVLAIVLAAVLLWPAEDASEPISAEGEPRRLPGATATTSAPARPTAAGDAVGARGISGGPAVANAAEAIKLPRLDVERIAAADPFIVVSEIPSDEPTPAEDERVLTSAPTEIRAVYRTARGAVAIVNDQIVPVTDAKKWIESMRSADADP